MKQSLGLLEVSGLALAISCADVMAKAASITLVGLEKTNGSGWTVIKIAGDVASVQSAIITGASFAELRGGLIAQQVIARPVEGLLDITRPKEAVQPLQQDVTQPESAEEKADADAVVDEPSQVSPHVSCNLCLDPACPRQKGEPRTLCIHGGKPEEQ